MKTIEEIPKYCITLPEKSQRGTSAQDHFAAIGLSGVQFVSGVSGEISGLRTLFPYEVDNPGSGFNIGPHCVGIWLSHYCMWFAGSLMEHEHILIMEDDVRFHSDWNHRINQALQDVPADFDWLFLGSCCAKSCGHKHRVSGEIWDIRYPMCLHAYIVAKKALVHILSTARKCYAPIDIHLTFHSFDKLKVYTLLPRVADQFNTDIRQ